MPAPASRDGLRLLVLSLDPPEHPDGHLSHSLALGGSGFEAAFDQGLLDPVAFAALLAECESGSYDHVHATFPSQTFDCSAARCLRPRDAPEGSGRRIAGGLTVAERAQLDAANALVQRGIRLFIAVTASGGTVSGESPSDLGDDSLACYAPEQSGRAFLAQMPEILAFQLLTGAIWTHTPLCFWADVALSWRSFLISPELRPHWSSIELSSCSHRAHSASPAYPSALRAAVVRAVAAAHGKLPRSETGPALCEQIRWGPSLPPVARRALAAERARVSGFAAAERRLPMPADQRWTVPFPPVPAPAPPADGLLATDWSACTDSDGSDDEALTAHTASMRPPRLRPPRVPTGVALRVAYWMLWRPETDGSRRGMDSVRDFCAQADAAMRALADGRPRDRVPPRVLLAEWKEPWALGRVWDCREAGDCRIVRRSTARTMFPGRQISRAAFARFAAAHDWHQVDPDIVEQVSGGGLEARSRCQQVTVLAFHSPGVDKNFALADDAIGADVDEGWVLGPFPDVPPFEPMRCLPRNVILSLKPKVAADGTFALVTKARVSTHASHGIAARGAAAAVDSPNAGLAKGEKTVALPTVQRHAEGAAVVDAFGNGDDLRAELYSVDGEKAFRFLPDQRAEWWMQCFVWLLAPGQIAPKPSAGAWAARRAGQPERRFGFFVDTRGDFGGGNNPSRYQRVANLKTAVARARHKEFDDAHPLPPCAAVVRSKRQALVAAGLLPTEPGQVEPRDMQAYLDDDAGSALNDITGVPPELAHVALDFSAMLPHRGAPSRLDSRVANHCRIVIVTNLDFGFFVSPKTQCGDPVLSLGLLVGVRLDRLSIPGYKIGVIVDQALALRDQASRLSTVKRDEIEQCVGRLVHVSQVALDILPSLHPGYRAAASHRAVVTLDGGLQQELISMLDEAVRLLQTDPGLPLIHASRVPSAGDPSMLVVHTDASRADVDDGFGGWAYNPSDAGQLFVCVAAWPDWLRPAMAASAARERDRDPTSSGRFSMPAAELFGALAVGAAIRAALPPGLVTVVLGVTDCKPACYAVQGSRSSSAAMRPLLRAMRADGTRWLSIWVPRDENSDADVASHPSLQNGLVAAARALGLRVSLLTESDILHEHWALAARAASIPWP